jgi:hypothetical protein
MLPILRWHQKSQKLLSHLKHLLLQSNHCFRWLPSLPWSQTSPSSLSIPKYQCRQLILTILSLLKNRWLQWRQSIQSIR